MEPPGAVARWAGVLFSLVPVVALLLEVREKLSSQPMAVDNARDTFRIAGGELTLVAVLELLCVALYAFPRTSVLGAVALTGYLGGAVVARFFEREPLGWPVLWAVMVWVGLLLREPKLRAVLPFRSVPRQRAG